MGNRTDTTSVLVARINELEAALEQAKSFLKLQELEADWMAADIVDHERNIAYMSGFNAGINQQASTISASLTDHIKQKLNQYISDLLSTHERETVSTAIRGARGFKVIVDQDICAERNTAITKVRITFPSVHVFVEHENYGRYMSNE